MKRFCMKTVDLKKLIDDVLTGEGSKGSGVLLLIVALAPILCFGYGAYHAYSYWTLKNEGVLVQAEIIRIEEERSYTSTEANFYPVVRFEDENGNVYEHRASRAAQGKYQAGDKEKVYFDADNPENVILEELIGYGMRAFLILMGLGLVGIVFLLNVLRQMR